MGRRHTAGRVEAKLDAELWQSVADCLARGRRIFATIAGKYLFVRNFLQHCLHFVVLFLTQEIAACFTAARLSRICRVLATDYRSFRKGFPDLVVWNPATKAVKLIEVKSHHDRISTTQSIWLTYLGEFGFEVELCHVKPKKKGVD